MSKESFTHEMENSEEVDALPSPARPDKQIRQRSTSGLELFFLSPKNFWYRRLKLLFTMTVNIDDQQEPVDIECIYVSFRYEMKLEPSGMK